MNLSAYFSRIKDFTEFIKSSSDYQEIQKYAKSLSRFDKFIARRQFRTQLLQICLSKNNLKLLEILVSDVGVPPIPLPGSIPSNLKGRFNEYAKKFEEVTGGTSELEVKKDPWVFIKNLTELYDVGMDTSYTESLLGYFSRFIEDQGFLLDFLDYISFDFQDLDPAILKKYSVIEKAFNQDLSPPSMKKFPSKIDMLRFDILVPLKFLGAGTFGAAFIVRITNYGKIVLKIASGTEYTAGLILSDECNLSKEIGCNSPYVSCVRECLKIQHYTVGIFMDYYAGYYDGWDWAGCAAKYVKHKSFPLILTSLIKQLFLGLKYIHSQGIAHKDLHPDNILIKGDSLMIIDFGLSYSAKNNIMPYSLSGRPDLTPVDTYEALIKYNGPVSKELNQKFLKVFQKADIFAAGFVLYFLCNRSYPFPNQKDFLPETQNSIAKLKRIFGKTPNPLKVKSLQPLLNHLLVSEDRRYTIDQAIEEIKKIEGV
jgi:tRNA A-37 threonylcarbamoyl transferase component Bud32